jgi:hypothetical protein
MSKLWIKLSALTILAAAVSTLSCYGSGELGRTYDWIITIQTEEVQNHFEYPGSRLAPPVKASVSYQKPGTEAVALYEDLWYRGWASLGCRRHADLNLGSNEQVAIQVVQKSNGTAQENAASANATLRLFLDCYLKGNMVSTIIVPDQAMPQFAQEMHRASFIAADEAPPDQPVYSSIVLHLQGAHSGQRQTLYYPGQTQ